jgi:peptidoglycan hydrolase-like protein with peptidoglycan-binding domain
MQHPIRAIGAWAVAVFAVLVAVPALLPGTAAAQAAATAPRLDPALLADASWHGRPIQRPIPRATPVVDRSPGLSRGTGYRAPDGSRRVRDLQRRLLRLGYRPGTRDGLFGPRTQAAVLAFQRKHGLEQDGSAGSETLALLRRRTAPSATTEDPALTTQSRAPETAPAAPPLAPAAASDDEGLQVAAIVLGAGALGLLVLAALAFRRPREPAAAGRPPADKTPDEPVIAPHVVHEEPRIRRVAPVQHHGPPWERRAALRERILAMKAEGMSLQEIADRLTAEGVPTLGGVRRWQPWSVHAATRPTTPPRHPAQQSRRHR